MILCLSFIERFLYYINVFMVSETIVIEALKKPPITIKRNNTERNTRSHVHGPTVQRILWLAFRPNTFFPGHQIPDYIHTRMEHTRSF